MKARRSKTARLGPSLVRAPRPELLEAPSSWLTRLAIQQGAELFEVLTHFGLPLSGNLELQFLQLDIRAVQREVGVPMDRMGHSLKVLANLKRIDPEGRRFLFREVGLGQFRYCPMCFKSQVVSYVPIHWRVVTWQYCPDHHCLMETGCSSCGAPTLVPANLIRGGPKGEGVAFLRDCARCGKPLAVQAPRTVGRIGAVAILDEDWRVLQNGRATLAAFYSGRVQMTPGGRNHGLRRLLALAKQGLVPLASGWLGDGEARSRRQVDPARRLTIGGSGNPLEE